MKLSTCTYGRRENKEKLMNKLDRPEKKLALELPVKSSIEVARRSGGVGKQSSACELCNRPADHLNVSKAHSNQLRFTRNSNHTASVDYWEFTVSHHM